MSQTKPTGFDPKTTDLISIASRANLSAYDSKGLAGYVDGAPHLKHISLRQLYAKLLVEVFQKAQGFSTLPPRVLDLGAGEGSVTLPMLELGAHVTAVDISPDQLAALKTKCERHQDRLTIRCEDIFDMLRTDNGQYDIIITNSFLHHIPDYIGLLRMLEPRLSAHGQFFAFQDPLFYSRVGRLQSIFNQTGYLLWRLGKGDVFGGLGRRLRRLRGVYREDSFHDNAEYHVLREGVDELAIETFFKSVGMSCDIVKYYSTQSAFFQKMGSSLGYRNTFAVVAARKKKA